MASMTVFNPSTTEAKFSLEYSIENDADGESHLGYRPEF